jgi:hypothetical protein
MAKNGSDLTSHWRSLVGEFRWPQGGVLLLILFISALAWLRTPDVPPYAVAQADAIYGGVVSDRRSERR